MKRLEILIRFWRDENGAESVEWPLFVGMIVVAVIVLWAALRADLSTGLSKIGEAVANPPGS